MDFIDLLTERRKDCDILWVSRHMEPLLPHRLPESSKYTRRQIIDSVLNCSKVQLLIDGLAKARKVDRSVIVDEALDMLKEMASKSHLPTVRWLGLLITKVLKRILMSIYLNEVTLDNLKRRMQISQVQYVYAPSHRSYLDFVLLSYILFSYDMALPNIASGMDFYRMKIVGELLRKTGAFYMRRSFSNDHLYKEIFRAYVKTLVAHSDRAIEFFIEGTRSRSQKSVTPKYGLLAIILEVVFQSEVPDIHFIPISINYDRPLEELLFSYELLGVPKPPESTAGLLKSLSILRDPHAHGDIYFNIAPAISAKDFLHYEIQKESALSPDAKLPSTVVKRLAYSIINSHKRNTILTVFNLIAVLYNENVLSHPNKPYMLDDLVDEFLWLQNILVSSFDALICTNISIKKSSKAIKDEISDSMKIHKDLIFVDPSGRLKIKSRHRIIENVDQKNIKGHNFADETMNIAIPVINMTLYINPTLAYFAKPALAALSTDKSKVSKDVFKERYMFLRKLLSSEFAFSTESTDKELEDEWQHLISTLVKEKCIHISDDMIVSGENAKLLSLLCNIALPYIAAVNITCTVLSHWNDMMGEANNKNIIVECQKEAEDQLLKKSAMTKHPYSLSLDLYNSSLASLAELEAVQLVDGVYIPNQLHLQHVSATLEFVAQHFSPGSYLDALPSVMSDIAPTLQAKLNAL